MKSAHNFILGILIFFTACTTDTGENSDTGNEVEVERDTVIVMQNDTVWMPGETDTVTVKADEKEDPVQKNWTAGIVNKQHKVRSNAVLDDIRMARHGDFERVVMEFKEQIPPYEIKYIDEPHHQCGSGKQMWLKGDGLLEIHMKSAAAHNEKGEVTVERKFKSLDNIQEVNLACDYEGHVNLLIGVGSPNEFAAFELQNPPRLVVDIKKGR